MIQDLIEKYEKELGEINRRLDFNKEHPWGRAFSTSEMRAKKEVVDSILKDLRELEGNQWISVAETKPPFGKWVMCYCRIHGLFLGSYEQIRDTEFGQWDDGNEKGVLPPTHWMELPDVPPLQR